MKFQNCFSTCVIFIIFSSIFQPTYAQIVPGQVTLHPADKTIPYNWFSYVPTTIGKKQPCYIVVLASGWSSNYEEITESVRSLVAWKAGMPDTENFILLGAAIPRSDIYAVAFDKRCFLTSTDFFYQRPDLKVNMMIDRLVNDLREQGYNVYNRVFVEGFSNEAMFAQRYCLLHPERVQAIAAGQCGGFLSLPIDIYGGTPLDWAIGVSDFDSLVGHAFNRYIYKQVPQFIYIGDADIGDEYNFHSHFLYPNPEAFWTQAEINFINNIFGATDPVRVKNECKYLKDLGYNVHFKSYPGIGHNYTSEMIHYSYTFFRQFTHDSNLAQAISSLQVLCGMNVPGVTDLTGDRIIDLRDVLYFLQFEAGLR